MKAAVILFCVSAYCNHVYPQEPELEWAKRTGSGQEDKCNAVAIDKWGNIYTTGYFGGEVDFDPGPGVYNLSTSTNSENIFVLKLDALGNFKWARSFAGGNGKGKTICCDDAGNVYSAGEFYGTVDFDPGINNYQLNVAAGTYISKLDADGDFIWAKRIGGESMNSLVNILAITLDAGENVLATGAFANTVDFDPGTGISMLDGGSRGEAQVFILKLNAAGDFMWVRHLIGIGDGNPSGGIAAGEDIVTDAAGNIFVSGHFSITVDFDPGPGVYNLTATFPSSNGFVLKLDAAGNFAWAKQFGKTTITPGRVFQYGVNAFSLIVDRLGNIYTSGYFSDTVDFDPGPAVYNLSTPVYLSGNNYYSNAAGFIAALDANGSFRWAHRFGEDPPGGILSGSGITTDKYGDVYIIGAILGTLDIDPGPTTNYHTAIGELMIGKYNSSGNVVWIKMMGQGQGEYNYAIHTDEYNNIYTAGAFAGSVDFDPGAGEYTLSSAGNTDVFIQKLRQCFDSSSSFLNAAGCNSYTLNAETFFETGNYTQTIPNYKNCDSIIHLDLVIRGSNAANSISNAGACGSYTWRGNTYYKSGTYSDTLTATNGCDSILYLQLVIDTGSVTTVSKTICEGDAYQGHNDPGLYSDTLASMYGCDSISNVQLFVNAHSVAFISTEICEGENYDGYTQAGHYADTIMAANGCDSIRYIDIMWKQLCLPVAIPKAFTPNGDGVNDLFRPVVRDGVSQFRIAVYNRYGEKLFETSDHREGWNGSCKGVQQPTGTYVYHLYLKNIDGRAFERKGTFLIVR